MDLTCKTIYCNVRNTMSFLLIVVFTNLLIHNEVNAVEQGSVDSKYTTCSGVDSSVTQQGCDQSEKTYDCINFGKIEEIEEGLDSNEQLTASSLLKYVKEDLPLHEMNCYVENSNQLAENTFDHITNDDIRSFTEELLKRDNSSLFQFFKYNIQGKANKNPDVDEAPEPLLQVDDQALQYPTVANVIALLDNYYPDARDAEDVTDEERKEENQFLDSIMDTAVMNYTIDFLREKGVFKGDREMFKNWLDLMWFSLYTRGYKKLSSSGFEHVFKGEFRKNTVLGMHNWISYTLEERNNHTNYYGWMKNKEFEKGTILTLRFKWNDKMKKVGSFFIGTSPEFEVALYSVCFILRNNKKCQIRLNGSKLFVKTYSICNKDSKRVVGSVYAGN